MKVEASTAAVREALHELHAGLVQAAHLALKAAVDASEKSAAGTTAWRDRTGATRASIKGAVSGDRGFVRASGAARYLEEGTAPHDIHGSPLRFQIAGQWISTNLVHHPGTKATQFMEQASRDGQQAADYGAEYFASYAIQKFNA